MLTGTSCKFSVRFCAVTTTSARPTASGWSSAARAAGIHPSSADATGPAPPKSCLARLPACLAWIRRNFRRRLRVTDDSPAGAYTAPSCSSVCQTGGVSKFRYSGIGIQDRAQCGFQRFQPRLEVPPLVESGAIDRLAHLLRAGRAHRALVLIEAQAAGLEGQAAIVEQAAYFSLGVLDHLLVEDSMNTTGQHLVEMRHELDVVVVVAAQVLEAISKILAAGEVLFESRKAAAQRGAPRIDDLRVRQDELDQAEVGEIVGQLVDEERRRAPALDSSAGEVLLTERPALRGIQ